MMRALRDVKVDNNSVGWYQCSYLGSFCTKDTIAHQVRARAQRRRRGAGHALPPRRAATATLGAPAPLPHAPCHLCRSCRSQVDFQTAIPGSVLIVYDGLRTGLGQLAVKVRARVAAAAALPPAARAARGHARPLRLFPPLGRPCA